MSEDRLARAANILGILCFFLMPVGPVVFAALQVMSIGVRGYYFTLIAIWLVACGIGICVAYFLDSQAVRRARRTRLRKSSKT